MARRETVHYVFSESSDVPACGLSLGVNASSTTEGDRVTCKACKSSVLFRTDFPSLALNERGRKSHEGRTVTVKFNVPPEMLDWWIQQPSYASAVIEGLRLLKAKEKGKQ
jgi:hypothetical protein